MKLEILNSVELNKWLNQRGAMGHDLISIKGPAPDGATYDDGDPILQPVNVAWQDTITGETFHIEYSKALQIPERITAGRFAEPLWGYDGNVGTFHEMALRYERDCKHLAIEALKQISTCKDNEKILDIANTALKTLTC